MYGSAGMFYDSLLIGADGTSVQTVPVACLFVLCWVAYQINETHLTQFYGKHILGFFFFF